jgi:hypothetical protein
MAVIKKDTALLARLKKQVILLQQKEERARHKLHLTLERMHKLGKAYKSKLSRKMRLMQNKLSKTQVNAYAKVAAELERKLMKGIEAKKRAFALALANIEKKHVTRLAKSVAIKRKTHKKVSKLQKPRSSKLT